MASPTFTDLLARCSEKEQRFILALLQDAEANQTRAYEQAGFTARGESASANASRLLRKDRVAQALEAGRADRAERAQVDAARVLDEVDLLAHSCLTHYIVDDKGHVQLARGAPDGAMRALRSIKHKVHYDKLTGKVTGREVEITLWDKPKALDLEGSHLGLWKHTLEISQPVPLFALPADARPDVSGAGK
jgi:phage terminase small subunit